MNWFHSSPCRSSGSALPWFSWTFPHGHRMSPCSCSKQEGNRKRHSSKTFYPWSGRKIILRHPPPSSAAFPLSHCVGHMAVPGPKRSWEMNICHFQLQQWEKGSATRKKGKPVFATLFYLRFFFHYQSDIFFPKTQLRCLSPNIIPYVTFYTTVHCQR